MAVGKTRHFGLRVKFLLIIGVLLPVILLSALAYVIRSNVNNLRASLQQDASAFAALATKPIGDTYVIYKDSGTIKIAQQIDSFLALNTDISNVRILNIAGKELFARKPNTLVVSTEDAATFEALNKYDAKGVIREVIYPYFDSQGAHYYSVVYDVSSNKITDLVAQQTRSAIIAGLLGLLATVGVVYLLINRFIVAPIRRVSEQAHTISKGNLEQQISVAGHDEIAELGDSVNTMADSLKTNIAELKVLDKTKSEFMRIASHNIRTPLTIINAYLDGAADYTDVKSLKKALSTIGISAKRLGVFADDVLEISRIELGEDNIETTGQDITKIVAQIAEEFKPIADMNQLIFESDIKSGERIAKISLPHFRSAVWNLLDNASKFTKAGGKIRLVLGEDTSHFSISVMDNGIGISPEELTKLFTKFHRGTSELTYNYEGTGIGLYATKIIVSGMGGDITVKSELGQGSTFTIWLAKAQFQPAPAPQAS